MLNAENVFLVGPMGSGKSAVGRQLAARLGLAFVDSDAEVEALTGVDIPYIFEKEGEAGFRARERDVLDALTARPGVLVATGGGAVQQLARTRRSGHRPLLRNPDPLGTLERLMQVRAPLYEETADLVVETDSRKVKSVVEEIERRLAEVRAT